MSQDLPPEAFTRETLQEAFNWLQEQPEPVRKGVHTPERLVSLFRKSQRLHDMDAPVSSKKFITDLKNLAGRLDQFDSAATPQTFDFSQPMTKTEAPTQFTDQKPFNPQITNTTNEPTSSSQTLEIDTKIKIKNSVKKAPSNPFELDSLSLQRIEEVRVRLNLGSAIEAQRMLISLGYENFTKL